MRLPLIECEQKQEGARMAKNNQHMVSIEEAADMLGISRNTAYEAARADKLPVRVIRIGWRYLIVRSELEALLGIDSSREPRPAA